jgi:hypothetical protein
MVEMLEPIGHVFDPALRESGRRESNRVISLETATVQDTRPAVFAGLEPLKSKIEV